MSDRDQLNRIESNQHAILAGELFIMATLQDIVTETAKQTTEIASMRAFMDGLHAQVKAAAGNQALIDKAFADAKANTAAITAAVLANTDSAPEPVAPVPPVVVTP